MKKIILLSLSLFLMTYFSSCSSVTDISGTWKKPATAAQKYNKIVVLGISGDVVKKSTVENAVVSNLKQYGINAVSSTNLLPPDFLDSDHDGKVDEQSKEVIAKKLEDAGVDGAFVISLVNVKESEHYVPGTSYYTPYAGYYGFNNYYWGAYNMVNSPGYITKSTNYFLSSNFYNMASNAEQLLWSAQSETFNPTSLNDFASSYASSVVSQFVSAGVVKK